MSDLWRRAGSDILIPGVDEELPLIPQLQEMLPKLITLVPSPSFVTLMRDKLAFANAFSAAGIDAPRTVTIDRVQEIGFPCLAKPRAGRGSRGIQILNSLEEVNAYRILARQPDNQLLVQELLKGQEWTVYVSADRAGNLRGVVPVKVNVKRGITIRAETMLHKGIEGYCKAIHTRFTTAGSYNVQLMETADGRLAAFEVNPRVSTTLCLAIAAGADPIQDLMRDDSGQGIRSFDSGVQLRRNWFNHIIHDRS